MKLCWMGEACSLEEAFRSLGYTKSSLKKSGLTRKALNRKLKKRSEVEIPERLFNRNEIFPVFQGGERPQIIQERESILALSKPSGIHCHPLYYNEGDNLLSFLRERGDFKYLAANRGSRDRGLLYRLDYETTGLCLVTCCDEIYRSFRESHHRAKKVYVATIRGEYRGADVLHHQLSTSGVKVFSDPCGREAKLSILKRDFDSHKNRSRLEVRLDGGLRHQIRVQLALEGYPLLGDTLYGGEESPLFGLHCLSYEWEGLYFEAPFPRGTS